MDGDAAGFIHTGRGSGSRLFSARAASAGEGVWPLSARAVLRGALTVAMVVLLVGVTFPLPNSEGDRDPYAASSLGETASSRSHCSSRATKALRPGSHGPSALSRIHLSILTVSQYRDGLHSSRRMSSAVSRAGGGMVGSPGGE